ncbi:hypothetical protein DQP55_21285 [Mycolicibacterium sp. GF69]|uniref:hypothetical protein n=1 Tax=Mycolicibacterium sp. GF69 TaxID=2267251 RepID=UPI000DCEA6F0|nr:hypothetical protein [Mycolicibacterium sp. GF69]RAV07564.1 hypothetical protein DQP55_21285 [Mycolicibacterium sp. GF69]
MTELITNAAALTAAPAAHPHLASAWGVVRGLWHSDHEPAHHHYPQRLGYLESAMMSRELNRP